MVIGSIGGELLLLLILLITIIIIGRKRVDDGIIISSNYLKLLIGGIIIIMVSIGGMVTLYIFQIPFYICIPLLGIGMVYVGTGLIFRKEWIKWIESYIQSKKETKEE